MRATLVHRNLLVSSLSIVAALGLVAGCKRRSAHDMGSDVLAANDSKPFTAADIDAVDVSFFLPPATAANITGGLVLRASELGECGGSVIPKLFERRRDAQDPVENDTCGALISKQYFEELFRPESEGGVPRMDEARGFDVKTNGRLDFAKIDKIWREELFVSAVRYDPCAPTAHTAFDPPTQPFSDLAKQCDPEFRLVVQHWVDGKPADAGFHVGGRLTSAGSKAALAQLIELKEAFRGRVRTDRVPIGRHPALELPSTEAEAFSRIKKIVKRFSGSAVTKGIAVFVTLDAPALPAQGHRPALKAGTRWQWAFTSRNDITVLSDSAEDPTVVFSGQVTTFGVPNVQGNQMLEINQTLHTPGGDTQAPSLGVLAANLDAQGITRSVGFEVRASEAGNVHYALLSPTSSAKTDLVRLDSDFAVKGKKLDDQAGPSDGADSPKTIRDLLDLAVGMENPMRTFVAPRREGIQDGFVGECSTCHIETPGKMRYLKAAGMTEEQLSLPSRYQGTVGVTEMIKESRDAYESNDYVLLNMSYHDTFKMGVHMSVNQRVINETAEVVRFIRAEAAGQLGPGWQSDKPAGAVEPPSGRGMLGMGRSGTTGAASGSSQPLAPGASGSKSTPDHN
jgi:hypothetical protein